MRRWGAVLLLMVMTIGGAGAESQEALIDEWMALVRRAETVNAPEMLLTPEAIRKIDALTERRRLQFGSNTEDNVRRLQREVQVSRLMQRIFEFKPDKTTGAPDIRANTYRFSAPLSRLSAHALRVLAKMQDFFDADLDVDWLSEDERARADERSDTYSSLLEGGLRFTVELQGGDNQGRVTDALLEAAPSMLGAMRIGQRKGLLRSLDVTYRKVDTTVKPTLDRFRQLLLAKDCVKFCAVLSQ